MPNPKSWNLGISKLNAFMQHLPEPNQEAVLQYHTIIDLLEEGSGEVFLSFRIPPDKLKPKVLSVRRGAYGGGPGHVNYSKEKYCESKYFSFQIHGLANYLSTLKVSRDHQENPYDDRTHAIAELMKSDSPQATSVSNTFNFQGSTIHGSNIVQGSPNATVSQQVGLGKEELRILLTDLKAFVAQHELSPDDRTKIEGDINTIDIQIAEPRPNHGIIKSSLESAKAVVEHTVGILAAEGIIQAIRHYLLIAGL
jgi:hypothetical protein